MKKLRKASLKTQIIIIITVHIILIPLLVTFYYNYVSKELISQKKDDNINMTVALQSSIENQYTDITTIMLYAGYSDACTTFLTNEITYQNYKNVYSVLNMLTAINKNIFSIAVTTLDNTTYSIPGYQSPLAPSCLDYEDGQIHYDGYTELRANSSSYVPVFSYSMNIISYGNVASAGEKIGYMTLLVNANSVIKEISQFNTLSNTSFFMVDSYNDTICLNEPLDAQVEKHIIDELKTSLPDHMNNRNSDVSTEVPYLISETTFQGNRYMIQVSTLHSDLGYTVAITPYSSLLESAILLRNMCYSIGFLLTVLTVIIYLFIILNFITPLNDLTKYIVSISHGNLKLMKKRVTLKGCQEIESISNEFNLMMEEINQIRDQLFITTSRLYEQEIAHKETKNITLMNQINPHFLFNTLDVIKGSVLMTGNKELYNVCYALGYVMKYCLEESTETTIKDELAVISNFLKIIDYRFGERITLEVEYSDELSNFGLPRLSLYPYIYQTVTARLEPMAKPGKIFLNMEKREEEIFLSITDNGIPITDMEETLRLLHQLTFRIQGYYPGFCDIIYYVDEQKSNHLEIIVKQT